MASGIVTYVPDTGKLMLTPDAAGGVFLQLVTFRGTNPTVAEHIDYPDAAGMSIFGILVAGGYHNANFVTPTDGRVPFSEALGYNTNGWPYTPPGGFTSTYAVFAR